jgi:hypothetical protein
MRPRSSAIPKKGDFYIAHDGEAGQADGRCAGRDPPDHHPHLPVAEADALGCGFREIQRADLGASAAFHRCTFGIETEEPEVVQFDLERRQCRADHLRPSLPRADAIQVRRFDDYVAKLQAAKVVLDPERRKEIILADARQLTFAQGYELVEDPALLDEVAGLVEWPVVLMGSFDKDFLSIPDEVIRATIRANQKCFVVRDPKTGS